MAQSPVAYRRVGRSADGWFPQISPGPELDDALAVIAETATAAGRDPAAIEMEGRVSWRGDTDQLGERLGHWQQAGATHVSVNTMQAGLDTVDDHLRALAEVADVRQGPGLAKALAS